MQKKILLSSVLFLTACGILDGNSLRLLEVAPYKAGCTGLGPMLCLQVRDVGEEDFRNLFETPIGFDYQWGFEYLISVEEEELDEVPADASSIRRRLDRVLSKTPVTPGSTFELLVAPQGLQPSGDSRYTLFSGPEQIECSIGPPCAELAALIASEVRTLLRLEFPAVLTDPFVLVGWTVCTNPFGPCLSP
jgi:hypothetical protein